MRRRYVLIAAFATVALAGGLVTSLADAGAVSRQFTLTNETPWNASGLNVRAGQDQYIGSIKLVGEYSDCHGPIFAVSASQNEASVEWPRACIDPGQYVTVRVEGDCPDCAVDLLDSWWTYDALGDANCDGARNSVDALELLQVVAGVLPWPTCVENEDVNGDGRGDALDASLILQFSAGLLPSLPV